VTEDRVNAGDKQWISGSAKRIGRATGAIRKFTCFLNGNGDAVVESGVVVQRKLLVGAPCPRVDKHKKENAEAKGNEQKGSQVVAGGHGGNIGRKIESMKYEGKHQDSGFRQGTAKP
jgi:hypothetical protein